MQVENDVYRTIVQAIGIIGIVGVIGTIIYVAYNQIGITVMMLAGVAILAMFCGVAVSVGEPEKEALRKIKLSLDEKIKENGKIMGDYQKACAERDSASEANKALASKYDKMEKDLAALMEAAKPKTEDKPKADTKSADDKPKNDDKKQNQKPPPAPDEKTSAV